MISCVMSEGRLFGLTPSDWSVLLGSFALCGLLTLLVDSTRFVDAGYCEHNDDLEFPATHYLTPLATQLRRLTLSAQGSRDRHSRTC
jgi:hypothetical protein